MVAVEGRLHQRSHHAAHRGLVAAAVALPVVLHAQPADTQKIGVARWEQKKESDFFFFNAPDQDRIWPHPLLFAFLF